MNRVVDRTHFRIPRRKAILILVAAAAVTLAASTLAFERGPYFCTDCSVASPVPDAKTLQTLKNSRAPIDYVPLFAWSTGTTYQICSATHCTVYHENFESNWVGEGRTRREGVTNGGGGGAGVGAGGGGGGAGGSGGTGGSGSVTVGKPKPAPVDKNER